jgi:hypothetical protein
MPVYYLGPMPKTDKERATMRSEAQSALRNMKDSWEQIAKTSQHGLNALLPASDAGRYNEAVHKLMISGVDLDADYFETAPPIPKNRKQGRSYDGVAISVLLSRVDSVLRRLDAEQ